MITDLFALVVVFAFPGVQLEDVLFACQPIWLCRCF